jgi:hypothetical protein
VRRWSEDEKKIAMMQAFQNLQMTLGFQIMSEQGDSLSLYTNVVCFPMLTKFAPLKCCSPVFNQISA